MQGCKRMPGAHSQGKSIEEVKENLKESIKMIVESNYGHLVEGYKDIKHGKISQADILRISFKLFEKF